MRVEGDGGTGLDFEQIKVSQNSTWAQLRVTKGVGYSKEGRYKDALRCFEEALATYPR